MEHSRLSRALGEPRIANASDEPPSDVVKSAGRALQVLELFDVLEREAFVHEVSELLNIPQSSTSVLMRSMVRMGYLYFNPKTRGFGPTSRVAMLGRWVNEPVLGTGSALSLLKELNRRFSATSVLAIRNQIWSQNLHVIQSPYAERIYIVKGARRPLVHSTLGLAILSTMPENEVQRLVVRTNAEAEEGQSILFSTLVEKLRIIKEQRYALETDLVVSGLGMIAIPLRSDVPGERLAIGVGDRNESLLEHKEAILAAIRDGVAAFEKSPDPSIEDDA